MRTVFGLAVLAAFVLAGEPPPASGETYTEGLVESKDDMSKGDWDGQKEWESKPPSSTPSTPGNTGPAPPAGGSGGTPTPTGGTTDGGGDGTTGGGGDLPGPGVPHAGGDEEEDDGGTDLHPGDGGTTNPGPEPAPPPPLKPAPLPACSGKFVLKEKQPAAELVSKQTLLTNLLYRNDVFAYISNGFCRSESTWFLDAFVTTRAYHDDTKEYEVTVALEGGCANCAPYFVLDGTSYIKAAARVRTSWGGIDAASTAKAQASTVWTGLLACSDGAEARITDCQTGGELKLAMAGLEFVARESRSDATETSTAGKGDHKDSRDNSVTMKVTNNATVHTDASGTENNSQAKALVGETMKIAATTKCGATATYELTRICR